MLETLPLDEAWAEIKAALETHQNLVLVAEPGAGKTTRFPPALLKSGLVPNGKKILMLEPRRIAARAAAHRIAEEQGWEMGREVGYQVRFEKRSSAATRLLILTEGLLNRRLQTDPELSDVGAIILDEFHERSQHTDLAIGLLAELQELARPDLRLIVMSATLDADRVAHFLGGCPIVRVPGRLFPVEVHHARQPLPLASGPDLFDHVAGNVLQVLEGAQKREGDVLVFLPGAREIRGVRERITSRAEACGFGVLELHGSLSLEDQERAIRRDAKGRGKVVLATNIAETSLTIDGVGTVVDSGLARIVRTDAAGFPRLQLSRISLASATQRAGRAGRQGAGHCYRLWSKLDEASMPAYEQPELLRTELTEPLLTLLSQGVSDPESFSWFEKPSSHAIALALDALTDLGFRDGATGALTPLGKTALGLPLSPRLAKLLIEAGKAGAIELGAKLAALLSEKDILTRAVEARRLSRAESDLLLRLHLLEERRATSEVDTYAVRNVLRVAESLEQSARRLNLTHLEPSPLDTNALSRDDKALRLALLAFPDRVARRRRPKAPAARMVGGRGIVLASFSTVETSELFVAIDSSEPPGGQTNASGARGDAQISIASRVERSWLESLFSSSISKLETLVFDDESGAVQKHLATSFRDLPLEDPHVSRPTPEEAFPALMKAALDRWETDFATHEELEPVLARLRYLEANLPGNEALAFDFDQARTSFLEEICFGETKLSQALGKPLASAFIRHLPSQAAKLLEEAAPATWTAPTGSRIRIQYPGGRTPYLEIRIQEIFGVRSSPRIALGREAVVMHLLGPNFRPVQVTSDLESFWASGYNEVRKELRARYPKHSWPEDPIHATPEAKGRRRS